MIKVTVKELPVSPRQTNREVVSADFDAAIREAERLVKETNDHDHMASASIISRGRTSNGDWRFVVRSWTVD